jgi:hypothetical protein
MSGNYGPAPRILFYVLILLSVLGRRERWIVNVALGTVMLMSSIVSVHSFALAVTYTRMMPAEMLANPESVTIGTLPNGTLFKTVILTTRSLFTKLCSGYVLRR